MSLVPLFQIISLHNWFFAPESVGVTIGAMTRYERYSYSISIASHRVESIGFACIAI